MRWPRRPAFAERHAEFAELPEFGARRRMAAGVAWFATHRWRCNGFIAPSWMMGPGAWEALDRFAFDYTATSSALVCLPTHHRVPAPCLAYSARDPIRRALSRSWMAALALMTAQTPLLRLALHPGDAARAAQRRMLQRRVATLLESRAAATLAAAVGAFAAPRG